MKKYNLKACNGESFVIRTTDNGGSVCPVCGFVSENYPVPAWWPTDGSDVANGSFEYCPCCDCFLGHDDMVFEFCPVGQLAENWERIRLDWLKRVNWNPEALAQLKNLEIDADKLKRDNVK